MKRTFTLIFAALLSFAAAAQTTPAEFQARYNRQTAALGAAGVGVETIINRWEEAFPEDGAMLRAKFSYYLAKSQSTRVVPKDQARYLGEKPVVTLKDSLGADVNYFQETFYEDSVFSRCLDAAQKAISLYPDDLQHRVDKLNALTLYEKESPDMACRELLALIDLNSSSHPVWKSGETVLEADAFPATVQEYCAAFYRIGTPSSYEAFRKVSEKMAKLYPKDPNFQSNLGSYWLVAQGNNKKALQYYKKALKINPDDYAAQRNIRVIESGQSAKGRSSK